jgi:hypothetical protein
VRGVRLRALLLATLLTACSGTRAAPPAGETPLAPAGDAAPVAPPAGSALSAQPAVATSGEPRFTGEAWPEADLLFRRDPRWLGADAAFSVDLGGERVLWLFGDTFVATSERRVRGESRMVRNSIALQTGLDPSRAAIAFHWGEGPSSWLPEQGEHWFWPGHGVRVPGGPLVLFFARVRATDPAAGVFAFEADGCTAVLVEDADADPREWRPRALAMPPLPKGILLAQGLFLEGEFVHGLALREPGDHAGFALRIPLEGLRRGELAGLELWDGAWSRATAASRPVAVLADAAPESSLHLDRALGRYVHVRSLGFGATTLAVSTAEHVTGPWSEPRTVYRPPESDRERPLVYAGKAHPELSGADLVATYACNSFDFGALVADTTLYYPRFVRLTRER